MKTVAFHNLGCKVNSYELEYMQQSLKEAGYELLPFNSVADIYIINTCSVTDVADSKSRQMIHKAKKLNPNALVIAAGCYVQAAADKLSEDESIDLLVGNNCKKDIVDILNRRENLLTEGKLSGASLMDKKTLFGTTIIDISKATYEECALIEYESQTRAYVKIQDGCDAYCTYCIIPYTRGRNRSRDKESVMKEVKTLAAKGCREFVLTGIHVSFYEYGLAELIRDICTVDGVDRLRLSSLEPRVITREFMDIVSASPEFCPHFHLSLQSGSDAVLKRMNRKYTTAEYKDRVNLIREYYPDAAITTDIITGFPGESEDEHKESLSFAKDVQYAQIHVFAFSSRQGTFASKMDDKITKSVKQSRSADLIEISRETGHAFREKFIGRKVSVLFEEKKEIEGKEYWTGYTPEYIKVYVPSGEKPSTENTSSENPLGDNSSGENPSSVNPSGDGLHGIIKDVTITDFLGTLTPKSDEAESMLGVLDA